MYRLPETGHTVSITKEKFLNTYPPLFNTLFVGFVQRAGCFFRKALFYKGTEKLPFFEWEFLYLAFLG